MITTIADAASYHYVWTAFRAILPVAIGAFLIGVALAWILWGNGGGKGAR